MLEKIVTSKPYSEATVECTVLDERVVLRNAEIPVLKRTMFKLESWEFEKGPVVWALNLSYPSMLAANLANALKWP